MWWTLPLVAVPSPELRGENLLEDVCLPLTGVRLPLKGLELPLRECRICAMCTCVHEVMTLVCLGNQNLRGILFASW